MYCKRRDDNVTAKTTALISAEFVVVIRSNN